MNRSPILTFVLAGGEGRRLWPLTENQAKPAVHLAHGCRIVDFVLANLVNSRIAPIYLLAQYKPAALVEHVNRVWRPQFRGQPFGIEVVLPQTPSRDGGFRGTAHAVYCCLHLIERHAPEVVGVFAADHVYRMDVRQMLDCHRSLDADVTVAAVPVPIAEASSFGIIAPAADGSIRAFQEKPAAPEPIPGHPDLAYASMGNYLFRPAVLAALLAQAARTGGTDFGKDILPGLPASGLRTLAYDFAANRVPGLRPWEESCYWRDVGTLDALAQAREDVKGAAPRFDLRNRNWPIRRDLAEPIEGLQAA